MKTQRLTLLKNQKGNATIESIPLLIIFVVLMGYSFGSYGIIHTGILHSIAARTYAFETFRHRTNVTYFRDDNNPFPQENTFKAQNRVHAITNENPSAQQTLIASERPLLKGLPSDETHGRDIETHSVRIPTSVINGQRNTNVAADPVWIQVEYGICLNTQCGDK